jgi:hypothetical protein
MVMYGFNFSAPAISISDLIRHMEPGLAPRRLSPACLPAHVL